MITKNAYLRYQTLDKCFRNSGRIYLLEDLIEACNQALYDSDPKNNGIQRRQLYDDIKFMESEQGWSIDLVRTPKGRKFSYKYSDLNFSIGNQPLNETEVNQMKSALMILSRFKGAPQFEWIKEIIPALENKLGIVSQEKEVISFDTNIDIKGLDHLTPLYNAIVNKKVLSIDYKTFNDESFQLIFHPYYLKQYNNRWFVFGLNQEEGIVTWNLSLDRIISIEETSKLYIKDEIDWEDYFYDIIGVSKPFEGDIIEVVLMFNKQSAPYIITKPLHPSQKFKENEDGIEVRIKVIPNYELESLILSFGEKVSVVCPEFFKNIIEKRLNNACENYK